MIDSAAPSTAELPETELLANLPIFRPRAKLKPSLPPIAPRPRIKIGQVLGKCVLIDRIGQGSSGVVFRARHQTLNVPVAVKVFHLVGETHATQQFRTEARLLARLAHPNVVRVWDFEDDPVRPYLVLEYVGGPNLADQLRRHGPLPPTHARRIVSQVAQGLNAAFQIGIVHRDVKPGNILLAPDGTVKLADLGLAMLMDRGSGAAATRVGVSGTVAYMPPEQAQGRFDHRSDIYALGASYFQMLTGRLPFAGKNRDDVQRRHALEDVVFPPNVPVGAQKTIRRMMAKSADQRFLTYKDLQDDLICPDSGE